MHLTINKETVYEALEDAICTSVRFGVLRAFKHVEQPDQEDIVTSVMNNVSGTMHEWFQEEEKEDENL